MVKLWRKGRMSEHQGKVLVLKRKKRRFRGRVGRRKDFLRVQISATIFKVWYADLWVRG
jgi:hypothetical protein